jgi:hypothetical protein
MAMRTHTQGELPCTFNLDSIVRSGYIGISRDPNIFRFMQVSILHVFYEYIKVTLEFAYVV